MIWTYCTTLKMTYYVDVNLELGGESDDDDSLWYEQAATRMVQETRFGPLCKSIIQGQGHATVADHQDQALL